MMIGDCTIREYSLPLVHLLSTLSIDVFQVSEIKSVKPREVVE